MDWAAGCIGDGVCNPAVAWRRDVRPSDTRELSRCECQSEITEPMRVRPRIVVDIGYDLTGRSVRTGVPRRAESAVLGLNQSYVVARDDSGSIVGGTVIHDYHFIVGIVHLHQLFAAAPDRARSIVRAHDYRDFRPDHAWTERRFGECLSDRVEGAFGPTIPIGQAEAPVKNLGAAAMPFVRPGERERTSAAC